MTLLNSAFIINSYKEIARGAVVLSLTSGQGYNEEVFYKPGRYQVEIAGDPGTANYDDGQNSFTQVVQIDKPFQIVATCNNPVFARDTLGIMTASPTIFGGSGGLSADMTASQIQGTHLIHGSLTTGGSVCHFIPIGGVFGSNYLRCCHCGAPASGVYGGSGAYGGGAGGRGSRFDPGIGPYMNVTGTTGYSGIGGSGGLGGTGTITGGVGKGDAGAPGESGSGVGAGTATMGGVAYFNGEDWVQPTRGKNTTGQAFIKITYLGA